MSPRRIDRRIDAELEGTFPASDPPSWSPGTANATAGADPAPRRIAARPADENLGALAPTPPSDRARPSR